MAYYPYDFVFAATPESAEDFVKLCQEHFDRAIRSYKVTAEHLDKQQAICAENLIFTFKMANGVVNVSLED